jgi:hypothetical protein
MCDACLRGKTNQVHILESVEADVIPVGVFEQMHKGSNVQESAGESVYDLCNR